MLISSLLEKFGALITWLIGASIFFSRYLLFAGSAYLIFYVWKKKNYLHLKIQNRFPSKNQISSEVLYSLMTAIIFGLFGFLIYWMSSNGWTQIYRDPSTFGYGYLFLSFVIMVLFHDAYFYWTHKLMHHRLLFKWAHHVHHQSHNPTPWAAFAFHPLEAVVEFGVLPIAVLLFPMNLWVILAWSLWMISWNVIGHLGFEMFPTGFVHHPFFKWINTSTHHNLHHERARGNYGLYFNLWDRLMKTNDPHYEQAFDWVKERGRI